MVLKVMVMALLPMDAVLWTISCLLCLTLSFSAGFLMFVMF